MAHERQQHFSTIQAVHPMPEKQYYILAVTRTIPTDRFMTLWGRSSNEKCFSISKAGWFDEKTAMAHFTSEHTMPIEKGFAELLMTPDPKNTARLVIENCEPVWKALGIIRDGDRLVRANYPHNKRQQEKAAELVNDTTKPPPGKPEGPQKSPLDVMLTPAHRDEILKQVLGFGVTQDGAILDEEGCEFYGYSAHDKWDLYTLRGIFEYLKHETYLDGEFDGSAKVRSEIRTALGL